MEMSHRDLAPAGRRAGPVVARRQERGTRSRRGRDSSQTPESEGLMGKYESIGVSGGAAIRGGAFGARAARVRARVQSGEEASLMRFTKVLAIAVVLRLALRVGGGIERPGRGARVGTGFTLDEYSVIASRASRLASRAGLALGNSYGGSTTFSQVPGSRGCRCRTPGRPRTDGAGRDRGVDSARREMVAVATLAVDKLFGMDAFGSRLTASNGVRFRTGPRLDRHTSVSFLFFGSTLYGSAAWGQERLRPGRRLFPRVLRIGVALSTAAPPPRALPMSQEKVDGIVRSLGFQARTGTRGS